MANPRSATFGILIFLLFMTLLSPDPAAPTLGQEQAHETALAREYDFLAKLNSSRFGDLSPAEGKWVNLTGLRQDHGFGWEALPAIKERVRKMTVGALGEQVRPLLDVDGARGSGKEHWSVQSPLYRNVTGLVKGQWVRSKAMDKWDLEKREETESNVDSVAISNGDDDENVDGNGATQKANKASPKNDNQSQTQGDLHNWPPRVNLSAIVPEGTYALHEYGRNITGGEGMVKMRFRPPTELDIANEAAEEVSVQLVLRHHLPRGDEFELTLHGIHFLEFGGIILTTTSEKFAGIFSLPHFALSPYTFDISQRLLNESLHETIKQQEQGPRLLTNPWSPAPGGGEPQFTSPQCEYVMYLQQHPIRSVVQSEDQENPSFPIEIIEEELQSPTGHVLPNPPPLEFSMLLFSPDCGTILESKGPPDFAVEEGNHLIGPKAAVLIENGRRATMIFTGVLAAQIWLLMKQLRESSTPSTRSRVSFYTIAFMSMGDGFAFSTFISLGVFVDGNFLSSLAAAFLSLMSVMFFGLRFMLEIWLVQATDERARLRQLAAANNTNTNTNNTTTNRVGNETTTQTRPPDNAGPTETNHGDGLPLPVTAQRGTAVGATPVIVRSDGELDSDADEDPVPTTTTQNLNPPTRRELGSLYLRFVLLLLFLGFTILSASTWSSSYRNFFLNTLVLVYLSMWCPQIYRNTMRNCRKALRWDFVVGQSILRLVPFAYFYTYTDNVLLSDTDQRMLVIMAIWLWAQVWALISQEVLGPRFFVKENWVPPAYDYHPILREGDEESAANMPIGFTEATTSGSSAPTPTEATRKSGEIKRDKGKRVWDCAICMGDIEVPVLPALPSANSEGNADAGSTSTGAGFAANMLGRRAYMVTPCRHIFHSPCLEGWMRYRLQCPICRDPLPPM